MLVLMRVIVHVLPCNLGQKVGEKFTKLSKVGFSMEKRKTSKFGFSVDDWLLTIKSKRFGDFLEIS